MTYPSPDTELAAQEREAAAGPNVWARLGAEAFGTFFLVLAILGVAMYNFFTNGSFILAVALAAGVALLGAGAAVGHISGGHFNPAVTLGVAVAGRMRWVHVIPYWIAQIVGGLLAALALFVTIPTSGLTVLKSANIFEAGTRAGAFLATANGFDKHSPIASYINTNAQGANVTVSMSSVLLMEVIATAVFVGVVLGVTTRRARVRYAPVAYGLSFTILVMVLAPFDNASMNPARSLASAVFGGSWAMKDLWVFIAAPLLGAAIAGLVARAFSRPDDAEVDAWVVEEEEFVVEEEPGAPVDYDEDDADSPADVSGIAFGLEEDDAEEDDAEEEDAEGDEAETREADTDGDKSK